MIFEWDDNKDKANQKKYGIRFEEVALIFNGFVLSHTDNRQDYGELREISIGMIGRSVVVVVVHTGRSGAVRIISARLANKTERKVYDEHYTKST